MTEVAASSRSDWATAMNLPELQFVQLERRETAVIVTLRRPERLNALHPAAHRELDAVFDALAEEKSLRSVIITGAGRAFCSGYDLRDYLETGVLELGANGFGGLTSRTDYPLPLIAAVNGAALGGGLEMALACDLIVAAEDAQLALPEALVGWSPLGGGLQRLPRTIGIKRTMDLVLTGRSIDAREGERLGFINRVVPREALLDTALDYARAIERCAPLAIACNREVAYASMDQPDLAAALDVTRYRTVTALLESEDATEGKRAFLEKRKPVWKGR